MGTKNGVLSRRGFSLVEMVSVLVVVVSVGSVLGPSVGGMRGQMRGVSSEGNLHTIGQGAGMYAADNQNAIFTLTWQPNTNYLNFRNGKTISTFSENEAGAWQVRDILWRATGRLDGDTRIIHSPTRVVQRRYSHLVLADYLGVDVADGLWADPADAPLLGWQADPLGYWTNPASVPYGDSEAFPGEFGYDNDSRWYDISMMQMWSFGSSYHMVPHSYIPDDRPAYGPIEETPHLFATQGFGSDPDFLVQRSTDEVAVPSAKVFMYEEFDREQEGSPYFAYDHAAPTKLMFDGSMNTAASGLARSSVSPGDALFGKKIVWEQRYVPLHLFPEPLGGMGDQTELNMRYRWTLGGLGGVDYPQVLMRGNGGR